MSGKRYGTKSEKQKAYRERKKNLSGGVESRHADVIPTEQPVDRGEQNVGRGDRAGSVGVGISGSSAPPAQNNLPAYCPQCFGKDNLHEKGCKLAREIHNLPVPVLAEPEKRQPEKSLSDGEARESTNSRTVPVRTDNSSEFTTTPDSCGGPNYLPNPAYETASHEFKVYDARIVTYDKKQYPNRTAWEIAFQRVRLAKRYAQIFPHLIGRDDLKFQTLDWQYENERLKAPAS